MGIFNFFIVIPEILASLGFGWVMAHLLNNNRIAAVVTGGVFLILASALTQRVEDTQELSHHRQQLATAASQNL
jgi:maltose/moltooligosaccharide transporter